MPEAPFGGRVIPATRCGRQALAALAGLAVLSSVGSPTVASAAAPATPATEVAPYSPATPAAPQPVRLPVATVRDVPARDRLFQRGLPVAPESFSPTGDHFAHLSFVRRGWLKRAPERCAFLLDLETGEDHAVPAPQGVAERLAGWDPTGRYLLVESTRRGLLFSFTGHFTTYHWVFDAVTAQYVSRRPFTGMRDGQRFRWNAPNVYHGEWSPEHEGEIRALYEGELAHRYQAREEELAREDERRHALAERLGVRASDGLRTLGDLLDRLDAHWTQRGQRDPVISDLFGDRPELSYLDGGGTWVVVQGELEHVAVLDHGLVLVTGHGASQSLLSVDAGELLPLPPPPDDWREVLDRRWDRTGGYYDETDPLPRDLQYRRSWDSAGGTAQYFNYITPDGSRLLMLYSYSSEKRVLRIVDLPRSWRDAIHPGANAAPSAAAPAESPGVTPDAVTPTGESGPPAG